MKIDIEDKSGSVLSQIKSLNFTYLFEKLPSLILVVLPDEVFTIAAMTDAYSQRSKANRINSVGKSVFEIFPDNPSDPEADGVESLSRSLKRALHSKMPDIMSVQKYSILEEDGRFHEAYWSAVNTPVFDEAGHVIYIIHKIEEITAYVQLQNQKGDASKLESTSHRQMETEIYLRALDIKKAHAHLQKDQASLVEAKEILIQQLYERTHELERASERTQLALDAGRLGEWDLDLNTGKAYRSLLHDKCFGHFTALEEWSYPIFLSYVHPHEREAIDRKFQDAIENRVRWEFECRVIWPDKTEHWIRGIGKADYDALGNPFRMAGIVSDITDEKLKEHALLKSQSYIRSLLDSTAEGIWGVDLEGNISFVNEAAIKLFGYSSAEQLIGKNSHALVHHTRSDGSPYPRNECPIFHAFEKGGPCHLENELLWRADGSSFRADYRSTPIFENEKFTGTVASFIDNTDRQNLLASLQENREWLSATLRSIGDAVIATSADNEPRIVFMNPIAEVLTGWSLEEAKDRPALEVFNIVNFHSRERAENPIRRVIKDFSIVGLANHTILISKDGKEYVIEDSAAPIVDSSGNLSGVVLVFRDATEKHLAEEREHELHTQVENARRELLGVFQQAPLPIAILMGPEHKFTLANERFVELTGRDATGLTLEEAFTFDEQNGIAAILDNIYESGVPYLAKDMPFDLLDKSGKTVKHYLDLIHHPFKDDAGRTIGIIAVMNEVTDQVNARNLSEKAKKAVENERDNFQHLFMSTPDMVCVLSGPSHRFTFVNKEHERILGFNAVGMTVREAQPDSIEIHALIDEVYQTGITKVLREEPLTVKRELRYFNVTLAARRDLDGIINGLTVLGSEVTNEVNSRLNIVKEKHQADAANNSKSAFIAHMSHEIRTPIGVISGFCELMQDEDLNENERKVYLNRVVNNAKGLTRIVDDILDLAKVEAGKLEIEVVEFSLSKLLLEVVDFFSDRAKQKNIYLRIDFDNHISSKIHSDPTRLRQIFMNIIGNAIKFTTAGGVTVRATEKIETNGTVKYEVRVIDTGIGLSKAKIETIFQPFVQGDSSTTRLFGGTGLGLVISRRLAIALGGNIAIEDSEEGLGCTVLISFVNHSRVNMLKPAQSNTLDTAVARNIADDLTLKLNGLRILLAEDSVDNQMLIRRILIKNGASVVIAGDGEEAISRALKENFDLILMDVQMPRVDGYEATRALRKNKFRNPIIALTAHAMIEEKIKSKNAGCNAHLTKPIEVGELIDTIRKLSIHGEGRASPSCDES